MDKDGEGKAYKGSILSTDIFDVFEQRKISGTLTVDDSVIASELLNVFVSTSGDYHYSTELTIPKGQQSIDYEILIAPGVYKVSYFMAYSEKNNVQKEAYYKNTGMVASEMNGDSITVTHVDKTDINITMSKGGRISGITCIPGKKATKESLYIDLVLKDEYGLIFFSSASLLANQTEGTHAINLPPGDYSISYVIYGESDYYEEGYFNGSTFVQNESDARRITIDNSSDMKIDLELEEKIKQK